MKDRQPSIVVDRLSKRYQLGVIGRHTLQDEIRFWWHKIRGRDPRQEMGKLNARGSVIDPNTARGSSEDFWALKEISFEVQPGEILGVIGRNGAGKSTLLKILSRITTPTSGQAVINGRVGSLLEVGTGFHPELTGRENIYMNGTILGMKKWEIEKKFDDIVSFSEIAPFIDTPVKRYSSGMYVRLAFAVAAHLEPEILVVDEVLAVGDAGFQKKCLSKMESVSQEGRTVLFVSHNMPAILRMCQSALLLEEGRLVDQGRADMVVAGYLARVAAGTESRTWSEQEAPGTSAMRLISVSVLDADRNPTSIVDVTEEVSIRLIYRVAVSNLAFRCMVYLSALGTIAFATMETVESVRSQIGIYSSTVVIPANLLAEQEYVVNVSIFSSRGVKLHYIKEKDVLSFQVVDNMMRKSARGDYTEGIGGVMRPLLKWKIDKEPIA